MTIREVIIGLAIGIAVTFLITPILLRVLAWWWDKWL